MADKNNSEVVKKAGRPKKVIPTKEKKVVVKKNRKPQVPKKEKIDIINFVQREGDVTSTGGTITTSASTTISSITEIYGSDSYIYTTNHQIKNTKTLSYLNLLELQFLLEFIGKEVQRYGGYNDAGSGREKHAIAIDRYTKVNDEIHRRVNEISW